MLSYFQCMIDTLGYHSTIQFPYLNTLHCSRVFINFGMYLVIFNHMKIQIFIHMWPSRIEDDIVPQNSFIWLSSSLKLLNLIWQERLISIMNTINDGVWHPFHSSHQMSNSNQDQMCSCLIISESVFMMLLSKRCDGSIPCEICSS